MDFGRREFLWELPGLMDRWTDYARWEIAADRPTVMAVDTETTGLGFYDTPFCATLTWRGREGDLKSAYISLEGEGADLRRRILTSVLTMPRTWVFHNAKFDLQKLELIRALPKKWRDKEIADTQVIHSLLDENDRQGLKHLARKILGEETNEEDVLKKVRRQLGLKKDDGYQHIPRKIIAPYALKDTEFTLRLYEALRPKLPADLEISYQREIELITVLLDMESNGIALDVPYLETTTSDYGVRVMEGWEKIVNLTGRPDLNPNSPAQLKVAFAARGVDIESTAVATLQTVTDELARAILDFRSDSKMHKTYLKTLLTEQRDGIIHPWFNPGRARTGRMSSSSASQ